MKAVSFLIRLHSAISTRLEEPQLEHVKSRGKVAAGTMPTWPHGHVTRISMVLHQKSPGVHRG
jgi:hypothetical protein